jgi:SnoaL-like domain
MSNITAVAKQFFEACETGKGWEVCQAYCTPNASFSAQAEPLAETRTLREYTDWMKGLLTFMPDGRYVVKSFATDDDRNSVCAYSVFSAIHTGHGGPCPPTGKSTTTDYVYVMDFDPAYDESLERRMGHEGTRLGLTRSSQPLSALLRMQSCRQW